MAKYETICELMERRIRLGDYAMKEIPAETPVSKAISKHLKGIGFRFVGPTTVYAFMQATGMVNDHLVGCPGHAKCAKLAKSFKAPKP